MRNCLTGQQPRHHISKTASVFASLTAVVLLVAACGGGGSSGSAESGGSGDSVTVQTSSGDNGTYLTDGSGMTLYMFAADTRGGKSQCSGSCAAIWPPVVTSGKPKAAGEAKASELGTISRGNGKKQVTYNGWPLYYYEQDTNAGQMMGQGINNSGGLWWILSPSGKPITTKSMSGSSGNGYGGGY